MNEKAPSASCFNIVVLAITAMVVPILVLPGILDNAFNMPKTLVILIGAFSMAAVYGVTFLAGGRVYVPAVSIPKIMVVLIGLNLFSFFYTENPYFTVHAAALNISCLLVIYFASVSVGKKAACLLLGLSALSGLLVSVETWLQFLGHSSLFKWAHEGMMVMGTIGNSNYLGAYLLFPLFAAAGMFFLLKGRWRLIPAVIFFFLLAAFLFARARAGWMGFFLALPLFLLFMKRIHKFSVVEFIRARPGALLAGGVVLAVILVSSWYAAPERFHKMMEVRQVTRSDTLRLRMAKYYPASWWLFKQSPLFGAGLWSYRNMVYEAQARINQRTGDFFKDYPEPKPRRVHMEYLEILNDGGLVAGFTLLLFFLAVMRHGWRLIRDEEQERGVRVAGATCFSSLVAVMLASFFFFSFRINSTLFMTGLMMGVMEGLYVRSRGLLRVAGGVKSRPLIPVLVLVLAGLVWHTGITPFRAEMAHLDYKKALGAGRHQEAERHLLRAIELDPENSAYCLYAAQLYMNTLKNFVKANEYIERATIDYNGDVTMWAVHFIKGLLKLRGGSLFEARASFERALYYNPEFQEAARKLEEVNRVIKEHDRVTIKFR